MHIEKLTKWNKTQCGCYLLFSLFILQIRARDCSFLLPGFLCKPVTGVVWWPQLQLPWQMEPQSTQEVASSQKESLPHPDTNPPRAPHFRDLSTRKVGLVSQGIRSFSSKENGNEITSLPRQSPLSSQNMLRGALTIPVWPPPPLLA